VYPFLAHIGGEMFDTLVKTVAGGILSAAWRQRGSAIALFKKIKSVPRGPALSRATYTALKKLLISPGQLTPFKKLA
jgi:hypothetical protein